MQKLLKRVATAERVVAKRRAKMDRLAWVANRRDQKEERLHQRQATFEDIHRAKQAIRDDWNLGPMAPNRNIAELAPTYGAISEARYQPSGVIRDSQREERCKWLGGSQYLNLTEGDRVVLLRGPDKGKIGKVSAIDPDNALVMVDGLNKSNVRFPVALRTEDSPYGMNMEIPLPLSAVRLVYPLLDPKTGQTRDVIISQLKSVNHLHDRYTGKVRWTRIVPGLNVTIPWPKKAASEKAEEHAVDTARIEVEERTFLPTLLRPPMPESVIDELRNKYSRFRTRHEAEYIARKEAEDPSVKAKENQALMESMRTPLQELHRAERQNKKKHGKPRLTPEMLELIGKVIAKNRARTLRVAGMSVEKGTKRLPASVAAVAAAGSTAGVGSLPEDSTIGAPPPPSSN